MSTINPKFIVRMRRMRTKMFLLCLSLGGGGSMQSPLYTGLHAGSQQTKLTRYLHTVTVFVQTKPPTDPHPHSKDLPCKDPTPLLYRPSLTIRGPSFPLQHRPHHIGPPSRCPHCTYITIYDIVGIHTVTSILYRPILEPPPPKCIVGNDQLGVCNASGGIA